MNFGLLDGREDGEHNGVGCVGYLKDIGIAEHIFLQNRINWFHFCVNGKDTVKKNHFCGNCTDIVRMVPLL